MMKYSWNAVIFMLLTVSQPAMADRLSDIQDSLDDMRIEQLIRDRNRLWEQEMDRLQRAAPTRAPPTPPSTAYIPSSPFKYIGKNTEGVVWAIDTTSILRIGNQVMLKVHTASDQPRYFKASAYSGSVMSMKIDCKDRSVGFDYEDLYLGRDRMGAKINSIQYDRQMRSLAANTMENLVYSFVCR